MTYRRLLGRRGRAKPLSGKGKGRLRAGGPRFDEGGGLRGKFLLKWAKAPELPPA
ncbi:hypothetical protein [Brockia lithotrophica]|uniref:hypothetical protein n=1 Tax=Brockia lithotrophica TaxID=933949 RepID=UPI001474D151|nr:hypothetical protein [Brockia lithotrophica]